MHRSCSKRFNYARFLRNYQVRLKPQITPAVKKSFLSSDLAIISITPFDLQNLKISMQLFLTIFRSHLVCLFIGEGIPSTYFNCLFSFENIFSCKEPMGSRPPKLLSNAKKTWFEERSDKSIAVFCQAQGYPAPVFR